MLLLFLIFLIQVLLTQQLINYGNARSKCATWKCKRDNFLDKISRELCIHKCIEPACYEQVYVDIMDIKGFNSQQVEDIVLEDHKGLFKLCINGGKLEQASYTDKRAACATYSQECKEIPQDRILERDLCQHKCMSAKCF